MIARVLVKGLPMGSDVGSVTFVSRDLSPGRIVGHSENGGAPEAVR